VLPFKLHLFGLTYNSIVFWLGISAVTQKQSAELVIWLVGIIPASLDKTKCAQWEVFKYNHVQVLTKLNNSAIQLMASKRMIVIWKSFLIKRIELNIFYSNLFFTILVCEISNFAINLKYFNVQSVEFTFIKSAQKNIKFKQKTDKVTWDIYKQLDGMQVNNPGNRHFILRTLTYCFRNKWHYDWLDKKLNSQKQCPICHSKNMWESGQMYSNLRLQVNKFLVDHLWRM